MKTISIQGWERFQHYKDRDPPWVKLYRDLLTSESWVLGTDTSRLLQVASILLAARYNNEIPHRWDLVRKVASLECTEKQFNEAVEHLCSSGFLEIHGVSEEAKPSASTMLATCTSEAEAEAIQRQSRERIVEQALDDPVSRVFGHWCREHNHPKAVLSPKRRKLIKQALHGFDEATLLESISGYKLSPFHMGQNEQRTVYDDIELFLRDVTNIERGLNCARAPPVRAMSAVEIAQQNLRKPRGVANGSVVAEQDGNSEGRLVPINGMFR